MRAASLRLDSITDAGPAHRGAIAVCGSHGGLLAGALASQAVLRAVILNDAGIGSNDAGIRGVMALADIGMASAAVDCRSACIGDAEDMARNGVLSTVNSVAEALGVRVGQTVDDALLLLDDAPHPTTALTKSAETRREITLDGIGRTILCVDSASLITPDDAGRIIVTGSHGGLIGNDPSRACKARAAFVAFNDAGGGKEGVGYGRLAPLDDQGIAAVTLDAMSCEIGDSVSSLRRGRISATNALAAEHRFEIGTLLEQALRSRAGTLG